MAGQDDSNDVSSDVKHSFAWGQLFAGSLIGGLAFWKLLHKMTNTEPSEWFLGLSSAFEELRDFLIIPLAWLGLALTAEDKTILIICCVLVGGIVRAWMLSPFVVVFVALSVAVPVGWILAFVFVFDDGSGPEALRQGLVVYTVLFILVLGSVWYPLQVLRRSKDFPSRAHDDPHLRRAARLILQNVLFTFGWGSTLLLLNWATS